MPVQARPDDASVSSCALRGEIVRPHDGIERHRLPAVKHTTRHSQAVPPGRLAVFNSQQAIEDSRRTQSEHEQLVQAATVLAEKLRTLQNRLEHGEDVMHMQHLQFADRASQLSLYLDAAYLLCRSHLYLPALAVLRCALEHHVFDWLLFEADRLSGHYRWTPTEKCTV